MDFFAAQDDALRRTKRLVWLYALAILAIVIGVYCVIWFVLAADQSEQAVPFLNPSLFLMVAVPVTALILGASAYKVAQYRQGGGVVAKALGGRRIESTTRDPAERRLVNIVEEMAIASGVPVPEIYVLDNEPGINAFAAGYTTHDAAVAVTKGALDNFSRDEMQGVMAHEFSHILNGDMRLNIRAAGVIFGVFLLTIIGYTIFRSAGVSRMRGSRDSKGGGAVAGIMLVGVAFYLLGLLGQLFGRLIQAAVSRQREFLADASAVQFTRNPSGISNALKRIGSLSSRIESGQAQGLAHFFFASGLKSSMAGAFATHPPLEKRIRAVEPAWDGSFKVPPPRPVKDEPSAVHKAQSTHPAARGMEQFAALAAAGWMSAAALAEARTLLESLPPVLREAGASPTRAQSVVLALLLDNDPAILARQKQIITQHLGAEVLQSVESSFIFTNARDHSDYLPILELSLNALTNLDPRQQTRLLTVTRLLCEASGDISSLEWCVLQMVRRHFILRSKAVPQPHADIRAGDIAAARTVLQAVWFLDEVKPAIAEAIWLKALQPITADTGQPPQSPPDSESLEKALDSLAVAPFTFRKKFLDSARSLISANHTITSEEAQWLKALAFCLEIPSEAAG